MAFSAMIEGLTHRLEILDRRIGIVAWGQIIEIIEKLENNSDMKSKRADQLREMVEDIYLDKGKYSFEDFRRAVEALPIDELGCSLFDKKRLHDLVSFLSTP